MSVILKTRLSGIHFKNDMMVDLLKELRSRSIVYFAIYLLFILPIIRANYFYVDDLGRALSGYLRWNTVGRPFASIFMESTNFNRWAVDDLAPLPQLMAIGFLAVASAWTSLCFRIKFGFGLLPIVFIVCNPFFLENLSYRYDSVTMSVAVVLAMLPLALKTAFDEIAFDRTAFDRLMLCVFIIISLVFCLNFYQPAINVFIVLACFTGLLDLRRLYLIQGIKNLLVNFASLAAAMVVYKLELAFIGLEPYASKHDKLIHLAHLQVAFRNVHHWLAFFANNLLHTHQTQLLTAGLVFGILLYFIGFVKAELHAKTFVVSTILAMLLVGGMLAGVIGPILLLQKPVYAPRVLIGFGALCACLLSLIVLQFQNNRVGRAVSAAILSAIFFANLTISYAYGNMLVAQDAMHAAIAGSIVNDAYKYAKQKPSSLIITGVAPRAYNVERETKEIPILNTLLPTPLKNFWTWGPLLKLHRLPKFIHFSNHPVLDPRVKAILAACDITKSTTTLYYNIYKTGHRIIVDFSKKCGNSRKELARNFPISDVKAVLLLQPFMKALIIPK